MTDREKNAMEQLIEKYEKFVQEEQDILDNALLDSESELKHKCMRFAYETVANDLKECLANISRMNMREMEKITIENVKRYHKREHIVKIAVYILCGIAFLAYLVLH